MNTIKVAVIAIIVMLGNQVQAAADLWCHIRNLHDVHTECTGSPWTGRCESTTKKLIGTADFWIPIDYKHKIWLDLYIKPDFTTSDHQAKEYIKRFGLQFVMYPIKGSHKTSTRNNCTTIRKKRDEYICSIESPQGFVQCVDDTHCKLYIEIYAKPYGGGEGFRDIRIAVVGVWVGIQSRSGSDFPWFQCWPK